MTSVRVVQYNLLTPHYATPEQYPFNHKKDLSVNWRLETIRRKLLGEMQGNKAVICLQEVCREWCGQLHEWFESKGYAFVHRLYGEAKSGYMGVGIAYPRSQFKLVQCDLVRPTDIVQWKGYLSREKESYWNYLYRTYVSGTRPPEDVLARVRSRWNAFVLLTLCDSQTNRLFAVATYHMPCDWRNPDLMALHALLLRRNLDLHEWRGYLPLILAGDFNTKPGDKAYQIFTEPIEVWKTDNRRLDALIADSVEDLRGDPKVPFVSAYKQSQGKEPDFTIHMRSSWGSALEFKDTLDYIFLRNCKATSALSLSNTNPEKLLPSAALDEPSDHLMLAATIEI